MCDLYYVPKDRSCIKASLPSIKLPTGEVYKESMMMIMMKDESQISTLSLSRIFFNFTYL